MALASASSPPMEAGGNHSHNVGEGDDDDEPMVTILPQEVIDALAELDLELSEGKIYFMKKKKFNSQLVSSTFLKAAIENMFKKYC